MQDILRQHQRQSSADSRRRALPPRCSIRSTVNRRATTTVLRMARIPKARSFHRHRITVQEEAEQRSNTSRAAGQLHARHRRGCHRPPKRQRQEWFIINFLPPPAPRCGTKSAYRCGDSAARVKTELWLGAMSPKVAKLTILIGSAQPRLQIASHHSGQKDGSGTVRAS